MDYEVSYEKNMTESFMKVSVGQISEFDEKILLIKKLPGLLTVEKNYIDNNAWYWYTITGKQAFTHYCMVKSVGLELVQKLIKGLCKMVEVLEKNALNPSCIVLEADYLFIDNRSGDLVFMLYPDTSRDIHVEFRKLIEFILTKLDHSDMEAVRITYELYERTLKEGYSLQDIKNTSKYSLKDISKNISNNGLKDVTRDRSEDISRGMSNNMSNVMSNDISNGMTNGMSNDMSNDISHGFSHGIYQEIEPRTIDKKPFLKVFKSRIEEALREFSIEKIKEKFIDFIKRKIMYESMKKQYIEIRDDAKEKRINKKLKNKASKRDIINDKSRTAERNRTNDKDLIDGLDVTYPEDLEREQLLHEQKKRDEHPTVCLTDYRKYPEGLLLYEGYEHFDNARLTDFGDIIRLGQADDVEISIRKETISHYHALITREGNEYYLEDLNSRNGTFVNGEQLKYKDRRIIKTNDIICLADVKYRLV